MERSVKVLDDRLDALRRGNVVRLPLPELAGDVLMILAAPQESTERVLEESLQDVREKQAVSDYAKKVVSQAIRDDRPGEID